MDSSRGTYGSEHTLFAYGEDLAKNPEGWRLEFLTGVPYRIAEIVNTKDLVYGDS